MPKSTTQKNIDKYFPSLPIAYQPALGIIFDSPAVGILISQLLYWQGKGSLKDGWIYKTIAEFEKETGLSRNHQDTAIRKCKEAGFLEVKHTGRVPRTRHFKLDVGILEDLIPSLMDSHGIVYLRPPRQSAVKQQTITEITPKTTVKNTEDFFRNKRSIAREKGF